MIIILLLYIHSILCDQLYDCNITIIGSGIGGLYSAYRLVKENLVSNPSKICVFEGQKRLGGLVEDENITPFPNNYFGKHALRINQFQTLLRCFASELNTVLQMPSLQQDIYTLRGVISTPSSDSALMVPCSDSSFTSPISPTPSNDTLSHCSKFNLSMNDIIDLTNAGFSYPDQGNFIASCYYNAKLLNINDCGWNKVDDSLYPRTNGTINQYANVRAFTDAWLGEEASSFLRGDDRFRNDFISHNATSMVDGFTTAWDVYGLNFYPVGGQSENVRKVVNYLLSRNVKIFKNEAITHIRSSDNNIKLSSANNNTILTKYLIINVPPLQFKQIKGDIADELNADDHLSAIDPITTVTIMAYWPRKWWNKYRSNDETIELRVNSDNSCLNALEFHGTQYINQMNVTRIVYSDNPECLQFWSDLSKKPKQFIINEIHRLVVRLFDDDTIPKALNISVEIFDGGWHYLNANSPYTNQEIVLWALKPLRGQKISFVGEAYNTNYSGWQDGAIKSALYTLQANYGLKNISKFLDCKLCGSNENLTSSNLQPCTPCGNMQTGEDYTPKMGVYVGGNPYNPYQCNLHSDVCPCTESKKRINSPRKSREKLIELINTGDKTAKKFYNQLYKTRGRGH